LAFGISGAAWSWNLEVGFGDRFMPSINVDLDYFEHPKVIRLVGLLGKGSEVLPLRLWCYTGKYHAEDGKLIGYSAQEIEASIKWWGRSGDCTAALVRVALLDETKGGYSVHDWLHHAGHIAAYRRKGKEMAAKRWGAEPPEYWPVNNANSNAASNAVSILLAMLTAMPTMYVGSVLYWGEEEIKRIKEITPKERTPQGAHHHPLLLAVRQQSGNERIRWVPISGMGIEDPTDEADTIAEADRVIKRITIEKLTAILCSIGGKTIKDRMARAKRELDEAEKEAAKRTDSTPAPRKEEPLDLDVLETVERK
jgi:hypothetical protein